MSDRDTTASRFFDVVGSERLRYQGRLVDSTIARKVIEAAQDTRLELFIRDCIAGRAPSGDLLSEYGEHCAQLAVDHDLEPEAMTQVLRECMDTIADRYGIESNGE